MRKAVKPLKFGPILVLAGCIFALAAPIARAASVSVAVTSSANPCLAGSQVTFTITVTPPSPGQPVPPGSLDFFVDGGSLVDTGVPFDATTDQGTYVMAFQGLGTHSVEALYVYNSGGFTTSASSPLVIQTVVPPPTDSTATTLTASPDPAGAGTDVTLIAIVSDKSDASLVPTGDVTFESDGGPVGDSALDPAGHASVVLSGLAPGSHSFVAIFAGLPAGATTTGWASSSSGPFPESVVAAPDPTAITLASSTNPVAAGHTVTFVAQIIDTATAGMVPQGDVSFVDNGKAISTAPVNQLGFARAMVRLQSGSDHLIAAEFIPRGPWIGSTSDEFDQLVLGPNRVSTPARCKRHRMKLPMHIARGSYVAWVAYLIDGISRIVSRRRPAFRAELPIGDLRAGRHLLTAVLHYATRARNHPSESLTGHFRVC
jgi:hypothetical protein